MPNRIIKDECSYIVYMHTTPNNKKYIGITKNKPNRRWVNGYGYHNQKLFNRAIEKYGWDNIESEILFSGLSKEQAEEKEIELIAYYKSNDPQHGYNIANGGNTIGTMSESTKEKISIAKKGKTHNSEVTRLKMSLARKGKPLPKETIEKIRLANKGKKRDSDFVEKIRAANMGNVNRKTAVNQYDKSFNLIKTWATITEAQRSLNIDCSHITKCCRGKIKSIGGYIWRYADEQNEGVLLSQTVL